MTLENELCALLEAASVDEAVARLGLVANYEAIVPIGDWKRGGAETFVFFFDVVETATTVRHLVIKACTPAPAGLELQEVFRQWLERRAILQRSGVVVPQLYFSGKCVVIEEVIPHPLSRVLLGSDMREATTRRARSFCWRPGASPVRSDLAI